MKKDSLEQFQQKIQYFFNDINLLKQALTHKSYNPQKNNERLEFLGDAVLDLIIGEYLFKKLTNDNEGNLTKMRASLVNEASFLKFANALNLGEILFISQSEINNNGRNKPSILSDAFEALIGAIYIDSDLEMAKKLTYRLLEGEYKNIDFKDLYKDYKTALQELTQALCAQIPEYILVSQSGPDHDKIFVMKVCINKQDYAQASGKSKKEAEQNAAKLAYFKLKK